jgi:hypothetical protein
MICSENKVKNSIKKYIENSNSQDYILVYYDKNSSVSEQERAIRRGLEEHIEELIQIIYELKKSSK